MEENREKFELGEIAIYSMLALGVDGLCLLLDLTGIGLLIAPFLQGAATFGFSIILRNKGDDQALTFKRQLGPQTANFLPFLPTVFGSCLRRIIIHNRPSVGLTAKI